ncbi:MAG: TMEM143 family protein [Caldilineaceae bacterium]
MTAPAVVVERESFIPYSREELIDLCLADGKLCEEASAQFRAFAELLAAYYNFQFHGQLEVLKRNFAPFDPDQVEQATPLKKSRRPAVVTGELKADRFFAALRETLECANYRALDDMAIHDAIANSALIDLKAEVDFNEFDQVVFYYRGATPTELTLPWLYVLKRTVKTEIFAQVVLGIKFKDADYFQERKANVEKLNFTPGLVYLYMYKNIPRYDLELLFPNVKLNMKLLDRLFFILPALGAGISVIYKLSSSIVLVLGLLVLLTMGPSYLSWVNVNEEEIKDFTPVLFAFFTLSAALGGFAYKQYSSYQARRMKFMKDVLDTLFFKNVASGSSVFHTVIDAAEEEETKEVLLVYYHLLTSPEPLTPGLLDRKIERWLEQKGAANVNFDVERTIDHMRDISVWCGIGERHAADSALLTVDEIGYCRPLSLTDAKRLLDRLWDNLFQYA